MNTLVHPLDRGAQRLLIADVLAAELDAVLGFARDADDGHSPIYRERPRRDPGPFSCVDSSDRDCAWEHEREHAGEEADNSSPKCNSARHDTTPETPIRSPATRHSDDERDGRDDERDDEEPERDPVKGDQ